MPIYPKLAYAIFTLVALLCSDSAVADNRGQGFDATFYVATNGDDLRARGSSKNSPFRTIKRAIAEAVKVQKVRRTAKIKIWVKAGEYLNESLDLRHRENHNHALSNTVIEGYRDSIGDIVPDSYRFNQENPIDPAKMPLLKGSGDTARGFYLSTGNIDNTLRNLQIAEYTERGVELSGANGNTLDNVIVYSVTANAKQRKSNNRFGGIGINCTATDCLIKNCVVGNAWGAGISVSGDENVLEDCHCFCDAHATDNGTDYYYPIIGSRNKVLRCSQFRDPVHSHLGHGFFVRASNINDSVGNVFKDCVSTNVTEAFHVMGEPARNPNFELKTARDNTFDHCIATKGSIYLGWASSDNTFSHCKISGGGARDTKGSGIRIANWSGGGQKSSSNNTFNMCEFRDLGTFVDFSMFWDRMSNLSDGPASGNIFYKCTFKDGYSLFRTQRPNEGNVFSNCEFSRIMHYHSDEGLPLNVLFSDSIFFDNGFEAPAGAGNIGYERSTSFPSTDIESGLVGHWKFDEADGEMVARDSASGGFDGELIGGGLWQPGKVGGCLCLETDQRVDMGDVLDLEDRPAISIAAWINVASWEPYSFIVDKHAGDGNYRFGLSRNLRGDGQTGFDNHLVLYAKDGSSEKPTSQITNDFTRMVPGRWYHVAAVMDSEENTWELYVDGIQRNFTDLNRVRGDTRGPLLIGNGFRGCIDDVRIYDRRLNSLDIKTLAEFTGTADTETNLIEHGDFQNGNRGWVRRNNTDRITSKALGSTAMSLGVSEKALVGKTGMTQAEAEPSADMKLIVSALGDNAELGLGFYYKNSAGKLAYFSAQFEHRTWATVSSRPQVYVARFRTPPDCQGTIRPVFLHRISDVTQPAGRLIIDDVVVKPDDRRNLLRNGDFDYSNTQTWQPNFDWNGFSDGSTEFSETGGTKGSRGVTGSPLRLQSVFKIPVVPNSKVIFSALVKGNGKIDLGFLINDDEGYRSVGNQNVSSEQFKRVFFEYAVPPNVTRIRPLFKSLSGSIVVDDLDMRYDLRSR